MSGEKEVFSDVAFSVRFSVSVDFHSDPGMQCIIRLNEKKVDNDRTSRESILGFFDFLRKLLWVCLEISQVSKRKKCWMYFPARLICFF